MLDKLIPKIITYTEFTNSNSLLNVIDIYGTTQHPISCVKFRLYQLVLDLFSRSEN